MKKRSTKTKKWRRMKYLKKEIKRGERNEKRKIQISDEPKN
jgi:hypothetical protein